MKTPDYQLLFEMIHLTSFSILLLLLIFRIYINRYFKQDEQDSVKGLSKLEHSSEVLGYFKGYDKGFEDCRVRLSKQLNRYFISCGIICTVTAIIVTFMY